MRRLRRRIESVRGRLSELPRLRTLVGLPKSFDVSAGQWEAIEPELSLLALRLKRRLDLVSRKLLSESKPSSARELNAAIGAVEMQMSTAFVLFDTYMDVLTQRHVPELGRLLRGCDMIAWSGLRKDHPALQIIVPPLVYCDRGFGASTLREGVRFPGKGWNPLPLIQIPYSRLKEKPNLTSILHEAGHEAMVRLGLTKSLPAALREALSAAPTSVRDLYALWSSEIGPDFWTFCACGIAETATLREILALPPHQVLHIAVPDPHPPPLVRLILSCEWCRQLWGRGVWDDWEAEWREYYPLESTTKETREMLAECLRYVPRVAQALLRTRFRVLGNRAIPALFDINDIDPTRVAGIAARFPRGLNALSPPAQLGVFRMLKEQERLDEHGIDDVMSKWLIGLSNGSLRN